MATPKDREKEAKVKELAEAIYVVSCATNAFRMLAPDAFLAAEQFYEESERRWEAVK